MDAIACIISRRSGKEAANQKCEFIRGGTYQWWISSKKSLNLAKPISRHRRSRSSDGFTATEKEEKRGMNTLQTQSNCRGRTSKNFTEPGIPSESSSVLDCFEFRRSAARTRRRSLRCSWKSWICCASRKRCISCRNSPRSCRSSSTRPRGQIKQLGLDA